MGFLDNSGDIILDAVLTDVGRKRLASGRFNIKKFALADDEINYALYRNRNHPDGAHPSGSAYYDLEILQTPILEAMTNAHSSLKSHLVTYSSTTKQYLPVLRINDFAAENQPLSGVGSFYLATTELTRDTYTDKVGVADTWAADATSTRFRIDQGLDTAFAISPSAALIAEDIETQYIIYMDNRLGELSSPAGRRVRKNFVDDDNVARYTITREGTPLMVTPNEIRTEARTSEIIQGPRGTTVLFTVKSSLQIRSSNILFDNFGSTTTLDTVLGVTHDIRYIDSIIRIVGATTGYGLDIPVRYIKLLSE